MFYHAFAAVPQWAPPRENHILYSEGVLKDVSYSAKKLRYTAPDGAGTEYLRLAYRPTRISVRGAKLSLRSDLNAEGYTVRDLGKGDFSVNIRRTRGGEVLIQ
jgi:hypothetical protein